MGKLPAVTGDVRGGDGVYALLFRVRDLPVRCS